MYEKNVYYLSSMICLIILISCTLIGCIDLAPVPVYGNVSTLTLQDTGISTSRYTIENVYDFDKTLTGKDLWGADEYTVDVFYYSGNEDGRIGHIQHQEINECIIINMYTIVIGYE